MAEDTLFFVTNLAPCSGLRIHLWPEKHHLPVENELPASKKIYWKLRRRWSKFLQDLLQNRSFLQWHTRIRKLIFQHRAAHQVLARLPVSPGNVVLYIIAGFVVLF
ncbi:hypothetical protein SETIT_9G310600v2 [Setaria italica]|uniref:Uncharacterized protein n=1 Tax=Setaria italica TaxID=4555 RepID=A0A368SMK0_SETIT|nr:hypothetical protein SETIT_9G310600v2 [Setaria italica]